MEKCTSSSSSSINGLKFGKKIYFEDMGSAELQHHKTGPPSPAKKGRTAMVAPPRCQVEGCNVDLRDAKAYYSKHKVCGMHSKSPKVVVSGIEQRFCQQCSRFHQLPEFDQDKRSCRRRLAGHNERRRKPSPGSLLSSPHHGNNSHGNSGPGGFVMDFTTYSTHSRPNAASGQVPEYRKPPLTWLGSSSSSNRPQNPVPELMQDGLTPPCHSTFNVSDSNGALSLLSNNSWSSKPCPSGFESSSVHASINASAEMPQYACPAWTLHDMPPDLGLGQASYHANNSYAGELGLAQPGDRELQLVDQSRGFGSSLQNMHWSR